MLKDNNDYINELRVAFGKLDIEFQILGEQNKKLIEIVTEGNGEKPLTARVTALESGFEWVKNRFSEGATIKAADRKGWYTLGGIALAAVMGYLFK